jgi:hypothetical protein
VAIGDSVAATAAVNPAAAKVLSRLMVNATLKMQAQPVADMERAARAALTGLRPAFEKRWRWQRWATLIAAFAAGCAVNGLTNSAAWTTATAVARHDARAELAQWQIWWNATCVDQSPRRIVVAGKAVCQVPMDLAAGK